MKKIENYELQEITGGINLSGTLISAVTKLINSVVDIGRFIGSSTRRLITGNNCLC